MKVQIDNQRAQNDGRNRRRSIAYSSIALVLASCLNVTGHEIAKQKELKPNVMKISIEGVMNLCTFIGYSFEIRAGFQNINVNVDAYMPGVSDEDKAAWLEETERRCPVTDNIKTDTTVNISIV